MNKTLMAALAACVLSLGLSGCQSDSKSGQVTSANAAASTCAACAVGKGGGTVWCEHCNAGYIAGKKMMCKECYHSATQGKAPQ